MSNVKPKPRGAEEAFTPPPQATPEAVEAARRLLGNVLITKRVLFWANALDAFRAAHPAPSPATEAVAYMGPDGGCATGAGAVPFNTPTRTREGELPLSLRPQVALLLRDADEAIAAHNGPGMHVGLPKASVDAGRLRTVMLALQQALKAGG